MTTLLRSLRPLAVPALAVGLAAPCLSASPGAGHAHASAVHPSRGILHISDEGVSDLASIDPPSPEANDAQSNLVEGLVFGGLVRLDQNLHVRSDAAAASAHGDRTESRSAEDGRQADGRGHDEVCRSAACAVEADRREASEFSDGEVARVFNPCLAFGSSQPTGRGWKPVL